MVLDASTVRQECAQAVGALARDVEAINRDVQGLQLLTRQLARGASSTPARAPPLSLPCALLVLAASCDREVWD